MNGQYHIVIILTILAFGIPILVYSIYEQTFKYFSLRKLTRLFNLTLIAHLVIAVMLMIIMAYLEKNIYVDGHGTGLTDIIMETGMAYLIIGAFFYLPGLLILNLINWTMLKMNRN